jgi:flagellar basal-body rod protein FlgF
MDVSTYVLLSQEQALRRRLDVIANNMANINTVGFRREQPVFQEYVDKNATPPAPGMTETSYVLDYGTVHDTSPGAFQSTGNPLDVMIDGAGYLTVEGPDGNPAYTRAGLLRLSSNGELVNSGGRRVLGANNNPIAIPPDQVGKIRIAENGAIVGPQGEIGRLGLASFQDESLLVPLGDGLFGAQGAQVVPAGNVRIRSGGVEGSNVQPIIETTQMIEVMRAYQNSRKALDGIRDMRAKAIDKLGRVG